MRFLKASALVSVTLFFTVLLLDLLSMRGLPARGGGGVLTGATTNGDVNCDGKVDIADAIFIIQQAFFGGPAPCAIAQDTGVLDKLTALSSQVTDLQSSVASLAKRIPAPGDILNTTGKQHF